MIPEKTSMATTRLKETLTIAEKLEACQKTRVIAAQSFATAISELLASDAPIPEAMLRDRWLEELRKSDDIFPDGWYTKPSPNGPPNGIGILFADEEANARVNYSSLREPKYHPASNIMLNRQTGIMYVYASPVDRKTGMIGDWGGTLYLGNNPNIISHLQHCWQINQKILRNICVGMTFKDLFAFAVGLFDREKVYNNVLRTDVNKPGNIGHTVPASYFDWTPEQLKIFNNYKQDDPKTWEAIYSMISGQRKFIDPTEQLPIQPNMAFTLEPRLTVRGKEEEIPMSSFHCIVIIDNQGRPSLLTNFDEVFRLTGMDYKLTTP